MRVNDAYESAERFQELHLDIEDAIAAGTDHYFEICGTDSPNVVEISYPEKLDLLSNCGVYQVSLNVKEKKITIFIDEFTEERPPSYSIEVVE